jgi:CBS domain containing-hemolysin-like protein
MDDYEPLARPIQAWHGRCAGPGQWLFCGGGIFPGQRPAHAIEELARSTLARTDQRAIQDPARFIAAVQVAITMAGLGLGWIAEPALADLISPAFDLLLRGWGESVGQVAASAITFIIITFVLIVVGELLPKSIALQRTEATALIVAGPTLLAAQLFRPLIWALNSASNILLRLFNLNPTSEQQMIHSVEEIKLLVDDSQQGGVLEVDEREMLHGVLNFGDLLPTR